MEERQYIPGKIPTKAQKLSPSFANACAWLLSQHLKSDVFYFTYCHASRAGHIGIQSGLGCGTCKTFHPWLRIDRSVAKQLANGEIPEIVEKFIDSQLNLS